jgi:hypothetical protein
MMKSELIERIEAYATAKQTGNPLLIRGSLALLEEALAGLPDDLSAAVQHPPHAQEA